MDRIFKKVEAGIDSVFGGGDDDGEKHSHSHSYSHGGQEADNSHTGQEGGDNVHSSGSFNNRFGSFAPESSGNVKWFVDGCSYFWAVSEALERKSAYHKPTVYVMQPYLTWYHRGPREHLHLGLVVESRAVPSSTAVQERRIPLGSYAPSRG